jgi:hypothetical protein
LFAGYELSHSQPAAGQSDSDNFKPYRDVLSEDSELSATANREPCDNHMPGAAQYANSTSEGYSTAVTLDAGVSEQDPYSHAGILRHDVGIPQSTSQSETVGVPVPAVSTQTVGVPVPAVSTQTVGVPVPAVSKQTAGVPVPAVSTQTVGVPVSAVSTQDTLEASDSPIKDTKPTKLKLKMEQRVCIEFKGTGVVWIRSL